MGKRSKFVLRNGKSTGYVVCFSSYYGDWNLIRRLTKDEAFTIFEEVKKDTKIRDAAVLHVEESYTSY